MKKSLVISFYCIFFMFLYVLNLFFFLHRTWVPRETGYVQSELAFLGGSLAAGNLYAYVVLILDVFAICSIAYGFCFIFKWMYKKVVLKERDEL